MKIKTFRKAIFILICLLVAAPTHAAGALFSAPNGLWVSPTTYNGTLYGPTATTSQWHVDQWGNPGDQLSPFVNGVATSSAENVTWNGNSYTVQQYTPALSCIGSAPAEFDSFIEANTPGVYPGYPSGGPLAIVPLSTMKSLTLGVTITPQSYTVLDTSCQVIQTSGMVGYILTNTVDGTTLYYQLELWGQYNRTNLPTKFWWATGPHEYGYTENLVPYGKAPAVVGTTSKYSLNTLPRILLMLSKAPAGMDKNPANWYITGTYHGNATWGHVNLSTLWSGFTLTYK
jgi:hypothetical protein